MAASCSIGPARCRTPSNGPAGADAPTPSPSLKTPRPANFATRSPFPRKSFRPRNAPLVPIRGFGMRWRPSAPPRTPNWDVTFVSARFSTPAPNSSSPTSSSAAIRKSCPEARSIPGSSSRATPRSRPTRAATRPSRTAFPKGFPSAPSWARSIAIFRAPSVSTTSGFPTASASATSPGASWARSSTATPSTPIGLPKPSAECSASGATSSPAAPTPSSKRAAATPQRASKWQRTPPPSAHFSRRAWSSHRSTPRGRPSPSRPAWNWPPG